MASVNHEAEDLQASLTTLKGVGPQTVKQLAKLGIFKIEDLLFHLPFRYIDKTRITAMGALLPGQESLVQGDVELSQITYGKRRSLIVQVSDGTGSVQLRFFYFSNAQKNQFTTGQTVRCFGAVRRGRSSLEIVHPEYRLLGEDDSSAVDDTLTPVYPATEGLQQNKLRQYINKAIRLLERHQESMELLPPEILAEHKLPALRDALLFVHRPPPDARIAELQSGEHPAQQRLAFEELLSQCLSLKQIRQTLKARSAPGFGEAMPAVSTFLDSLPFQLTEGQQLAFEEISADITGTVPMLRLVQGDVGSGKTVVAALAALRAIGSGYQCALMAPTELLAEQHFRNFKDWFSALNIDVVMLKSKLKKSEREHCLQAIQAQKAIMVIGTHALFQEGVEFGKLGLVIIDEQHRFGVQQRLALLEKGTVANCYPHQLIMTATPIPRTLTMSAYADLDVTIIHGLPPGRTPVNTVVMNNHQRERLVQRLAEANDEGRQIYWVCTLIDESETIASQNATATYDYLKEALPEMTTGLIHGRLKNEEKDDVMQEFKAGEISLLVATTVIEVGVDVPNASLMVIENAERLGLAQLHQLRGRVGRGAKQSDCILLYQAPLGELAKARLETMRNSNDGFVIAEKDLELRGPGELLGTRQTGMPELQIADLNRDATLLPAINSLSERLLNENAPCIEALIARWQGHKNSYGQV